MTSFGILYGLGDMRTPLFIAVGVNAINLCLDGLLIFGAGPVPPLGIAGAAIASSTSQILATRLATGKFSYNKSNCKSHLQMTHNVHENSGAGSFDHLPDN